MKRLSYEEWRRLQGDEIIPYSDFEKLCGYNSDLITFTFDSDYMLECLALYKSEDEIEELEDCNEDEILAEFYFLDSIYSDVMLIDDEYEIAYEHFKRIYKKDSAIIESMGIS